MDYEYWVKAKAKQFIEMFGVNKSYAKLAINEITSVCPFYSYELRFSFLDQINEDPKRFVTFWEDVSKEIDKYKH